MFPFSTTIAMPQNIFGLSTLKAGITRWRSIILSLVTSLVAIIFVFQRVNIDQFFNQLVHVNPMIVAMLGFIYLAVILLRAWRWHTLVDNELSIKQAAVVVNISYFFNTIWPFRVGEIARIEITRRYTRHNFGDGLALLFIERLFDLCLAVTFALIGLVWLQEPEQIFTYLPIKPLIAMIFLVGFASIVVSKQSMNTQGFRARLQDSRRWHPFIDKIWQQFQRFIDSFNSIREAKRLKSTLLFSIILWALYLVYYQVGLHTIGISDFPLGMGLLVVGFAALGIAAPSLPGAIGIFHAAVVLALSLHGHDATLATSYAWLVWVPQTIVIIVSGMLSIWLAPRILGDTYVMNEAFDHAK